MHNAFRQKDGSVRYIHIKVKKREKGYFTHDINGSGDGMYTADNICKMIEFLINNTDFCAVWRASFPSDDWNSNGNQLCSITC